MKQQLSAVLISALLLSTLAIEHQKARHHPQVKHHQDRHKTHLVSRIETNKDDQCVWYCPDLPSNNSFDLYLTINITTSIIGLANVKTNVAVAVDNVYNAVTFFNGCGGYVAINLTSNSGIYFNSSKLGWVAQNETFSTYINCQSSFKCLLEANGGVPLLSQNGGFPICTQDSSVEKFVSGIMVDLSVTYEQVLKSSTADALELIEDLLKTVSEIRNPLIQFLKLTSDVTVKIQGDFISILTLFQGLSSFGSYVEGGFEALSQKNISFNFTEIATAKNGIDVLAYLIVKIKAKLDINSVLGNSFGDDVKVMFLIDLFSGGSGLANALYIIYNYIENKIDIDAVIAALITSQSIDKSQNGNESLREEWTDAFRLLYNVTQEIDDCCLKAIVENHWIVKSVNLSAILDVFYTEGSVPELQILIKVLILLKNFVPLTTSVPHLILKLIKALKSFEGIYLVSHLDPNLNISNQNTSILNEDLQNVTVRQVLNTKCLLTLYSSLKTVGQIIQDVNSTLLCEGGPSVQKCFETEEGKEILFEIGDFFIAIIRQREARRLGKKYIPAGKALSLHNRHLHPHNKHHEIHEKHKNLASRHHLGLKQHQDRKHHENKKSHHV